MAALSVTGREWIAIFGGLALASLIPIIWAIVDVARRPPWQFSPGRKVMWAVTLGVGWFILWPVALISSVVYLAVIRKRFPSSPLPPGGATGPYGYGQGYGGGYYPYQGYGFGQSPPTAPPPPPEPPVATLPPAGWYSDPGGSGRERWWDGRGWTDHLR